MSAGRFASKRLAEGRASRRLFVRSGAARDEGLTLVEISTSVAVMLIVLTAAWMLLTVSSDNLGHIEYGGQATELNRAALASFERDLNHSVLPAPEISPILATGPTSCSILVDEADNGDLALVTWKANEADDTLVRVVTRAVDATAAPTTMGDFADGVSTTTTVLTGLDWRNTREPAMFSYKTDALTTWDGSPGNVGLVTFHLRNGLPDPTSNVTDRTAAIRVISYVINGY